MSSADSSNSSYALAVSFIVSELIRAYESGSELNFTQLKGTASRKFRLKGIPKMADILQALPM
jgi:histone acetyltransferase (RNA polymerase elongator complex component)